MFYLSSVRIKQFTGHLMQQSRIVEHFFDLLLRTTIVEQCLNFIRRYAERLCHTEQIIIVRRCILVVAAVIRITSPPMFITGFRRECASGDIRPARSILKISPSFGSRISVGAFRRNF